MRKKPDWKHVAKKLTTDESLAVLEKDPQYMQGVRELDREEERLVREYRRRAAPMLRELVRLGFEIEGVDDLYNSNVDYRAAIPVLLKWLPRQKDPAIKENIVRALSIRWARPVAARPLLVEWNNLRRVRSQDEELLKFAIGNALSVVSDDSVFDDVARILRDRWQFRQAPVLVEALGNMKDPRASELLLALLKRERGEGFLVSALRTLKRLRSIQQRTEFKNKRIVRELTRHQSADIRREAKRTLQKLES